ncbi:hypothetical protein SAMN05216456_1930 [Devosia crocina]|uniref:HTH cro/C1-type domain-containing protein n=1 Tax=Devosia crocina TaxID=429728 RepID=A0A1I7NF05_9HYPH|nr:helix-turn-helix transcriptional regulator [Devosia crocina]SFV33241.1 hypothetical protein SAMN05216456_1930 [Devosia crocina]
MDSRRLRADVYLALKTEFRELRKEVGSQERAAELTRVDQQTISLYENRNRPEFAPLDVVADLLDVTGSTALLQQLADVVGAVVIKLPEGVGPACVIESSGKMAVQLGKVMVAIGQALADGQISEEESERIVGKLQGVIVSAHALSEQIKAEAAK